MGNTRLDEQYRTIKAPAEGGYSERKSKFLSFAIPIECEADVTQALQALRKRFYDARHICWAYRIGKGEPIERMNDDGEPSSTAGKPILGQIVSRDLTEVLVAVVRYFGGIKLGTSGLINAYREAASDCLNASQVVEVILYTEYEISFPFDLINHVMMLLRAVSAETIISDATAEGHLWRIKIANSKVYDFEEKAKALYQMNVKVISN